MLAQKPFLFITLTTLLLVGNAGCNLNQLAGSLQQLSFKSKPGAHDKTIEGNDIVQFFTGLTEQEFIQATNATIEPTSTGTYKVTLKTGATGPFNCDKEGNILLTNAKTGGTYKAGIFETYSHEQLIAETKTFIASKKGSFNVVTSTDYNTIFDPYVDTLSLQYQAALNGERAAFLVASNYDGIEEVDATTPPSIDIYLWDVTQGPIACFGCFPGALLRLYSQKPEYAQVKTNFFDAVSPRIHMLHADFLDTQNGYLHLNQDITSVPDLANFLKQNNYSFSIMYHKNQAASVKQAIIKGHFDSFVLPSEPPQNTVDQILSAGLSLGMYKDSFLNGHQAPEQFIEAFAKQVFFDIYDASIRSAIKNHRETLYLLPIGCGVFGNKKVWAGKALERCKKLIEDSGITVNYIISGLAKRSFETQTEFHEFIDTLSKLAKETGGSYLKLSVDEHGLISKNYTVKKQD